MTCAITIVQKPVETPRLRKSVRSDAPSTTSGVVIGRKMKRFVAPRPRKLYRTSASAISVPRIVATSADSSAISMLTRMASPRPGTPKGFSQLSNVKPDHV